MITFYGVQNFTMGKIKTHQLPTIAYSWKIIARESECCISAGLRLTGAL
jgi:hypothetical protein